MAYLLKVHWKDRLAFWVWEKWERHWLHTGVYMVLGFKEGDQIPWWSPSLLIRGRQSAYEKRRNMAIQQAQLEHKRMD